MQAAPHRPAGSWFSGEWPYWVGGVVLAAVNTAVVAILGRPWGVTGPITNLGGRLLQWTGLNPEHWRYFRALDHEQSFREFDWLGEMLWLNIGVMVGALLAGVAAGEWRLRTGRRRWGAAVPALFGGFLMGYGTRLSAGCNAGALLGGIPSLGLHGWVFLACALLGLLIGLRLFRTSVQGGPP